MSLASEQQEFLDERNRRWDEPFGKEPLTWETVQRILDLPVFADVKPSDYPEWLPLEKIVAYDGRLVRRAKGEAIIRKGDYGNSLFVILEGAVIGTGGADADGDGQLRGRRRKRSVGRALRQIFRKNRPREYRRTRRRLRSGGISEESWLTVKATEVTQIGRTDIDRLLAEPGCFELQAPQMFGELAALTRTPRSASVYARDDDTLLFELRWQGLRDIRDWSEHFRTRIDQLYSERGLVTRLQECPVFSHLDQEALDEIAREALFETYGNFNWTQRFKSEISKGQGAEQIIRQEPLICEQGTHVDGLLLINSGFGRVSEKVDQGERTLGQVSRNDVFGLDAIHEATQGQAGNPVYSTSLRAIGYLDVIRIPTHLIRRLVLPGLAAHQLRSTAQHAKTASSLSEGMMNFLVDHRFINGEQAMLINLDRCVGCDDCVRACATAHDNNPRFVRQGPSYENAMIANACMHCTDPVCLIGCPTGAIHRVADQGTVVIDENICVGCATCANSCPYNNIVMVDIRDETGAFLKDSEGLPIARATKCDFCIDQLTGPSCVQACPYDALARVNLRNMDELQERLK